MPSCALEIGAQSCLWPSLAIMYSAVLTSLEPKTTPGEKPFTSALPQPPQQGCAALRKILAGAGERLTKRANLFFRDYATSYECLPQPHSPTPHSHIRRIARPPTPTHQLLLRFDLRAKHTAKMLQGKNPQSYMRLKCETISAQKPNGVSVILKV